MESKIDISPRLLDSTNIVLGLSSVRLSDGTANPVQSVINQGATSTRAGAMRAQQVTDLVEAKANIATLAKRVTALQGNTVSSGSNGIAFGPPFKHTRALITPANMVTPIVEFSVIFSPEPEIWIFGR